jgi:hypothetical protein
VKVPVNNVGQFGVILDVKPHELPINAWTAARNIRFDVNYAEKFKGYTNLYGGASTPPYWLLNARDANNNFWLYAGLTKVYATDGTSHTDISRAAGGAYGATADVNWNGCVFNGVPVLNNGVDVPQYWALPMSMANKLQALPNWNANWRANSLRGYKNYLVAVDVTKTGVRYPQMVKWSHPADPGTYPTSWDETDPTKDAGEFPLSETGGACIDSFTLRDTNIIYKDDSFYGQQFVGGQFVFRFYAISREVGILSRRCAVEFVDGNHAVFGSGDLFTHDGQNVKPIGTKRVKNALFSSIDSSTSQRSFVVRNVPKKEVWFCYPETGQTVPNKALVWSYNNDTFAFRDIVAAHIEPGVVIADTTGTTWNSDAGTWDSDGSYWDASTYDPSQRRLLEAAPGSSLLLYTDTTEQFNAVNFQSYIERTGIGIPLEDNQPPDFTRRKMVRSIWPRITGTAGRTINVYVGSQEIVGGPVTYAAAKGFVIGTTKHLDFRVFGRLFAVKFESTDDCTWQLHGYELDMRLGGRF